MSAAASPSTRARSTPSTAWPNCWRSTPPKAPCAGARAPAPPARSAPTVADGRLFLTTIDGQLLALRDAGRPAALDVSGNARRRPLCWVGRRRPMPRASWSPASARASSPRCAPTPATWSGPTVWPAGTVSGTVADFSTDPRNGGDQQRRRLRHRRRRADGRVDLHDRPTPVGTPRRRRRISPGSPATGCSWSPWTSRWRRSTATTGELPGSPAAALGRPGQAEGPDHVVRPGAGRPIA